MVRLHLRSHALQSDLCQRGVWDDAVVYRSRQPCNFLSKMTGTAQISLLCREIERSTLIRAGGVAEINRRSNSARRLRGVAL